MNKKKQIFIFNKPTDLKIELKEKNEEVEIIVLILKVSKNIKINIELNHIAPKTKSTTIVKSVLSSKHKFEFYGIVNISEEADNCEAVLSSKALLLNPDAQVITLPALFVKNNNSKAMHSSTISKINNDNLFYLNSRGINDKESEQLIVKGFVNDLLGKAQDCKIIKL